MMPETAATFSLEDQHSFARISGDFNPMHLDVLYARRTQAAELAVHGIHGLLVAMEREGVTREAIGTGAKVRFESFLYLDQPVELRRAARGTTKVLELVSGGRLATSIALDVPVSTPNVSQQSPISLPNVPRELGLEEVAGEAGTFVLGGSDADYRAMFPGLAAAIGARRVRALGSLSTLVGMLVPGLHSIFSRCEFALIDHGADEEALTFQVMRTNPVLRTAAIAFRGSGIAGRIDAFVRTPPVIQPSIGDLASRNALRDFAGRRALVIGGSRGLGELSAKLLAVRGAEVTVTYLRGRDDAERVARELQDAGYKASVRRFDTAVPDAGLLRDGNFTDVLYYATPPIFARRIAGYDPVATDRFMAVYCHHFAQMCELLAEAPQEVSIFWPSSTAVDGYVAGLAEYAAAKAAGENLCEALSHRFPKKLRILARRLPRLDTDQTASVIPAKSESAETVISNVLDALAEKRA